MIKWEYTVSRIDTELNAQVLNRSGDMGWELVQIFSPNPRLDQAVCIWKRRIREDNKVDTYKPDHCQTCGHLELEHDDGFASCDVEDCNCKEYVAPLKEQVKV